MIELSSDLYGSHHLLFLFFGGIFFAVLLYVLGMAAVAVHDGGETRPLLPKPALYFLFVGWGVVSVLFVRGLGVEYAFVAAGLALATVLSLLHPVFAFGFFISLFILRPWEILENSVVLILPKLMIVLSLASLVFEWFRSGTVSLSLSRAAGVLGCFLFWVYLSTFKTADPRALQVAFFDSIFKVLVVFILCQNVITSRWAYRVLSGVIAISVLGLGAIGILYSLVFGGEEAVETGRLATVGMLGNSNDIAAIMILGFPFALKPILVGSRKIAHLAVGAVAIVVTSSSIWLARSRGAILALLVSFGLLLFLRSKRKWLVGSWAVVAIVVFPILVSLTGRGADDLNQSRDSRVNYWIAGMKMAIRNPVLGVGYESYPKNYESYAPSLSYEWGERTAHSSWVLVLAETGVPGLVLFTWFFVLALKSALQHRQEHPEILLSLVGYLFAISFLSHSYLIFPYLVAAIAFAPGKWAYPSRDETRRVLDESTRQGVG